MKNPLVKILISVLFSIFFLYLAFKDINLNDFWESLRSTSWLLIFSASAMAILSMFLRAWRWRKLLKSIKNIPLKTVFDFTMIGFMGNNLLPAHAGDLAKPYLLGIRENIDGTAALATVLIERLLDSVGMVTIFLAVVFFSPLPNWLKFGLAGAGGVTLLLIMLLMTMTSRESIFRGWLLKLPDILPQKIAAKVREKLDTFLMGINVFQDWRNLIPLLGISILTWAHMALNILMIMWAYPMQTSLGLFDMTVASVVTMVILAFAIILPSAPGYIGITQLAFAFSLGFYGISEADAVGISVIFHLTQYIPITAGGIIILLKEGMTIRQMKGEATEAG